MTLKKFDISAGLDSLNPEFESLSMRAGWNKKEASLWQEPRVSFKSAHWKWAEAQAGLDAAAPLISTELAERRNLFLVNPVEGNHYATLRTLVCAYQMICPGERARSHHHSPNALRLVLEVGPDVYTVVNGERLDMKKNDVVLTLGNMWHGHANDGPINAYWIDFLDVPLVQMLEPMFMAHWPQGFQEPDRANQSKDLCFAWEEVEKQLLAKMAECQNGKMARVVLDAPNLLTMELSMTMLAPGASTLNHRSTENQIVAVVEGNGETCVGGQTLTWTRGDVLALPGWLPVQHFAKDARSTLFSVSDARMQARLGFLRVENMSGVLVHGQ
jgi:gentisate 1,2-dioxygenase